MIRSIAIALAATGLLVSPVLAQDSDQMCEEAATLLETSGMSIELPDDTTSMQACTIVGIMSDDDLNNSQKEFQVKKVLGME